MNKKQKAIYSVIGAVIVIFFAFSMKELKADRYAVNAGDTINNYYPTTIISGVSASALAEGLTVAMAAGGHQFDYSINALQGSIVGSYESGEQKQAVSFGLAKRFNGIDTLFHGSYTQAHDVDYFTFGGTWRF